MSKDPKRQIAKAFKEIGVDNYGNDISGEIEFLEESFKGLKNPLVLDVGANRGWYSAEVLNICPLANVYAFEPHPVSFEILKKKASSLYFTAINSGCGSENKKATIYDDINDDGSEQASLMETAITGLYGYETISHEVDIIRLDEFLDSIKAKEVYFVKIDAEGSEYDVLQGLGKYLTEKKISIIQFEFSQTQIYSRHYFKDFYDLLSADYNMYRLMKNQIVSIDKYEPMFCEVFAYQNIVCIRK